MGVQRGGIGSGYGSDYNIPYGATFVANATSTGCITGAQGFFATNSYYNQAGSYLYLYINSFNSSDYLNYTIAKSFIACDVKADCIPEKLPYQSNFYTQLKNTSGATDILYSASSTASAQLKILPADWIVAVGTTTDSNGDPYTVGGYNWYPVTDPTDGVTGWMKGSNSSSTVVYLPYALSNQTSFQASSTNLYTSSTTRATLIQEAVEHYYDNSDTNYSLYSSDDAGGSISYLNDNGYPLELILGISSREDGGNVHLFNNENISPDYGHGAMQLTLHPTGDIHEYDNRGHGSGLRIPPCSLASDNYLDCYGTAGGGTHTYIPNTSVSGSPTFKFYTNTYQSIYSNIKDGMQLLAEDFEMYDDITTGTTVGSTTYSALDRKTILATKRYNGANCGYVNDVANNLDNLDSFFPAATTTSITGLIAKMHTAGTDMICADLLSPGVLSIQNSKGQTEGVFDGKEFNDFPLADFDREKKFVNIFAADEDEYSYRVQGTDKATYGINITRINNGQVVTFKGRDIPTNNGEVHTFRINEKALTENRQDAVSVEIDKNGDGTVDKTIHVGNNLNGETFKSLEEIKIAE